MTISIFMILTLLVQTAALIALLVIGKSPVSYTHLK